MLLSSVRRDGLSAATVVVPGIESRRWCYGDYSAEAVSESDRMIFRYVPEAEVVNLKKRTVRRLNSPARCGFIAQRPATKGSEADRRVGRHAAFCRTSFT